jgi:hypothetical protein
MTDGSQRHPVVRAVRRRLRPVKAGARRVSRAVRPLRPPLETPERTQRLSLYPEHDFLSGNGIAARCRYVLNYDVLTVNEDVDNDWWFCKADFLEFFFREVAPRDEFVLFSHNADRTIDRRFARRLRRRQLRAWFAENADFHHPKLFALPLGIANPRWPHGDGEAVAAAQRAPVEKTELFNTSFALSTNPTARAYCLEQTGLELGERLPFPEYLLDLKRAWFCISPRGNGIDTHRTWEALYVGTIPVVTRSLLTEQHPDLPFVVLDDWAEFRAIDFSPELYRERWGDFDPASLRLDAYLRRVEAILARLG